jgi:mannose-1-phosphate guanylyltransferase
LNEKEKQDGDRFVIIMAGGAANGSGRSAAKKRPSNSSPCSATLLSATSRRPRPAAGSAQEYLHHHQRRPGAGGPRQLPKLPKQNVIAEPVGRDTCAAVTLGAAIVGQRSTSAVMAVLPADHVIPGGEKIPASPGGFV